VTRVNREEEKKENGSEDQLKALQAQIELLTAQVQTMVQNQTAEKPKQARPADKSKQIEQQAVNPKQSEPQALQVETPHDFEDEDEMRTQHETVNAPELKQDFYAKQSKPGKESGSVYEVMFGDRRRDISKKPGKLLLWVAVGAVAFSVLIAVLIHTKIL